MQLPGVSKKALEAVAEWLVIDKVVNFKIGF